MEKTRVEICADYLLEKLGDAQDTYDLTESEVYEAIGMLIAKKAQAFEEDRRLNSKAMEE